MITLSNGYEFDFCCGSGALGFDGTGWYHEKLLTKLKVIDPTQFTVVIKTLTLEPKLGNLDLWKPWRSVRLLPNYSATNAIGLTNPGLRFWINNIYPTLKYRVAVSIKPDDSFNAGTMAILLNQCDLAYIELNLSCPNINDELRIYNIVAIINEMLISRHPIIVKLSIDQVNKNFIKYIDGDIKVEAYHAINTIPWNQIYSINELSPLEKYPHKQKGGVSGKVIHEHAMQAVKNLSTLTTKPIIGGGGIFSLNDVSRFKEAGANAFSIGTLFIYKSWKPNKIIRQYRKEIDNG